MPYRRVDEERRDLASRMSAWGRRSYNPVSDRTGRVTKVIKFATDITAQQAHDLDLAGQIAALHRSQAVIATDQIRGQIGATQAATREAVEAIGSIQGTIRALDAVSASIAAVEEQSAVTREMSGSMQTAAHGAAGIALGIEAIAAASGRVDAATRQVREAARTVA